MSASALRPAPDAPESRTAIRVATACLVGHAALSIFSAYAFSTFLTGAPPAWLQTPTNQAVMRVAWALGPATTVVLGALAGLLHAAGRIGGRRALLVFAVAFTISLGAELLGTSTGFPFGAYSYTPQLGYRVLGLVPFNIPTSWFFMLYCSLAICGRLLAARDDARTRWRWAVVGGFVLTAWDVSMDPAMVKTTHWLWHLQDPATQSLAERLVLGDIFYGMPLSNWLGWLLTGTIVARAMLALVPPSVIAARVSPSNFPLVLYAVNGVLPVAICARNGMWWAVVFGTLAMAVPVALAVAKGPRRAPTAERVDRRSSARVAMAGD